MHFGIRPFSNSGFTLAETMVTAVLIIIGFLALISGINMANLAVRNIQLNQSALQDQIFLSSFLGNGTSCKLAFAGLKYKGTPLQINKELAVNGKVIVEDPTALKLRPDGLIVAGVQLLPQPLQNPPLRFYVAKMVMTYKKSSLFGSDTFTSQGIPLSIGTDGADKIISCQSTPLSYGGNFQVYLQCDDGNFPPTGCPASWFLPAPKTACRIANSNSKDCQCAPGFFPQPLKDFVAGPCWWDGVNPPWYTDVVTPFPPKPLAGPGSAGSLSAGPDTCGIKEYQCVPE